MSQPPPQYPPQYPPHQPPKSGVGTALIVILIAIPAVIALIGVLSVLAIFGVRKYIGNAKQAEARNTLGQIGVLSASAYERDHKVCASASQPIPVVVPRGTKYMSTHDEWTADAAKNAGFACLGLELSMPQYYQYDYQATSTGFTATARGDLNGDGVPSTLSLMGQVQGDSLVVAPALMEENPGE